MTPDTHDPERHGDKGQPAGWPDAAAMPVPTSLAMSQLSDAELSRLVAERVAGWTNIAIERVTTAQIPALVGEHIDWNGRVYVPPYATSADAVLPLLGKAGSWMADYAPLAPARDQFRCAIRRSWPATEATAPTFARAACLSLLKAAGEEV